MRFYKDQMYAVVSANQTICSYLTFAHEMGHNLGSDHDFANSSQRAAYAYSYGYRFNGNSGQLRTVMAYDPGIRIPYFSNPRLSYDGHVLGDTKADNAGSISLTSPIVAAFFGSDAQCASVRPLPITIPTTAPALQQTTVDMTGTKDKKSGKYVFQAAAFLSETPLAGVALALRTDRKLSGAFTKVVSRGTTTAAGSKSFKVKVKKSGYYKACLTGDSGDVCSTELQAKVSRR